MSGIIQFKNYEEALVRTRDLVKKMAYGVEFAVLGVESQQKIHYAMPLRTLLYDGLGYLKEYQEITRSRRSGQGKMTEDEFLSKMCREDRLHPIVSIVVYYSEKSWDGPMCLKDMIVEMPEEIGEIFSDYRMNLVQVRESDKYQFHNEDVRTVFEISRELFKGNFGRIEELYGTQNIKSELLAVIGKITDSRDLVRQSESKEVKNMCTALERLKEEGIQEGIQKSVLKLLKKGLSVQETSNLLELQEEDVSNILKEAEALK